MSLKDFALIMTAICTSCANVKSDFPHAKQNLDASISEKMRKDSDPFYNESVRPISLLFSDTRDILDKYNLTSDEKKSLVSRSLKEYEKLYSMKGIWVGEHAESASVYLGQMCAKIDDKVLSSMLSQEDFRTIRSMLAVEFLEHGFFEKYKNYPETKRLLRQEKKIRVPLYEA